MDRPLTPLDRGDHCCRWCYEHRKYVLAIGSAMALCLLFVGVVLMAHFADRTPGWTLLIAAACICIAFFTTYIILRLVRCLCPRYVGEETEPALEPAVAPVKTADTRKPIKAVFLNDGPGDVDDDFEL
jgi:hypothetical protein